MAKHKRPRKKGNVAYRGRRVDPVGVRIVGGRLRGRKLSYAGDQRVRPMKDRTREAVFNLLGPAVRGMWAVDLFAGTGAMAIEAISRGAVGAVLIERHLPTARVIQENITSVGVTSECTLVTTDVFYWAARLPKISEDPWLVFCCPPYDFFVDRQPETLELIERIYDEAPPGSAVVVESDQRFDHKMLPQPDTWDSRQYAPAVVAIRWKD